MTMYTCTLAGIRSLGPLLIEATSEGDAESKFRKQIQCGWDYQSYKFVAAPSSSSELAAEEARLAAYKERDAQIRRAEPVAVVEEPEEDLIDDEDLDEEDED